MKKAQSETPFIGNLGTAAKLILTLITIGVLILILYISGLLTEATKMFCTVLTRFGSMVRGIIISIALGSILTLIGIFTTYTWLSPSCFNPKGAVICGATTIAGTVLITTFLTSFAGGLPLFTCALPPIHAGTMAKPLNATVFEKTLAENMVDCYYMYGANKYNALFGKTPPNPRICQLITYELKQNITLQDIDNYLANKVIDFKSGQKYYFTSDSGRNSKIITFGGIKWNVTVYFHVWNLGQSPPLPSDSKCTYSAGQPSQVMDYNICVFNVTNPSDYNCTCDVIYDAYINWVSQQEVNGIPFYIIKDWRFGEIEFSPDTDVTLLSEEDHYWWSGSIFVGEVLESNYKSKLGGVIGYVVDGVVPNDDEYDTIQLKSGRLVISYYDHWSVLGGKSAHPVGSAECNIQTGNYDDPIYTNTADQIYVCLITNPLILQCNKTNRWVCLDDPLGRQVLDTQPHEYIGYCNVDGTITNVTSCSTNYCDVQSFVHENTHASYCDYMCKARYYLNDITKNASCYKNKNAQTACTIIQDGCKQSGFSTGGGPRIDFKTVLTNESGDAIYPNSPGAQTEYYPNIDRTIFPQNNYLGECKVTDNILTLDRAVLYNCGTYYDSDHSETFSRGKCHACADKVTVEGISFYKASCCFVDNPGEYDETLVICDDHD